MFPETLLLLILLASAFVFTQSVNHNVGPSYAADVARDLGFEAADLASSRSWSDQFELDMRLMGDGFHRSVQYEIAYGALDARELRGCGLALLQHLPSSIFADPYQLEEIIRSAASSHTEDTSDATSLTSSSSTQRDITPISTFSFKHYGPLDLELPAPACDPTALLLEFNLTSQQQASQPPTEVLTVPLHAKYPEPQAFGHTGWQSLTTGHVGVLLPQPLLIVDCRASGGQLQVLHAPTDRDQHEQGLRGNSCEATPEAQCESRPVQEQIIWSVPAGDLGHMQFVSWATLFVTATCCVLLSLKAVQVAAGCLPGQ